MPRKCATLTAEFKLQAVKMITDQKLAVAEVAPRLDIRENLLRNWREVYLERGEVAYPGHRTFSPADDELPPPLAGRHQCPGSGLRPRWTRPGLVCGHHVHSDAGRLARPRGGRGSVQPRIVGWSMSDTMESRLVVDALAMAIARGCPLAGLVAHSDRGSQYASDHYQRVLASEGIVCSMSGVGQCWDNAPVESFFGRLKCEMEVEVFATRDQARVALFEYLEVFYNRVRRHSSLGFVSPVAFERMHNPTQH